MQQITLSIPPALQRLSGSAVASTHGTGDVVVVVLADDLIEKAEGVFSPKAFNFGREVTLNTKETLARQMSIITAGFERTEGTLWRVSTTNRQVSNLLREYCNQALPAKSMLFGDHPKPVEDKFYLLFVPNKHNVSIENSRMPQLIASNDLVITFVQRSWEEQ